MTDQPIPNQDPNPSCDRPVTLTYDDAGRIVSQREDYPVSGAVEGPADYHCDAHGRLVCVTQPFHNPLTDPGTQ